MCICVFALNYKNNLSSAKSPFTAVLRLKQYGWCVVTFFMYFAADNCTTAAATLAMFLVKGKQGI